jgi:hypothetical protein
MSAFLSDEARKLFLDYAISTCKRSSSLAQVMIYLVEDAHPPCPRKYLIAMLNQILGHNWPMKVRTALNKAAPGDISTVTPYERVK